MYSDIHWCSLDGGSVQLEHSIIAAQKTKTVEYNSSLSSSLQQSTAAFNASSPSIQPYQHSSLPCWTLHQKSKLGLQLPQLVSHSVRLSLQANTIAIPVNAASQHQQAEASLIKSDLESSCLFLLVVLVLLLKNLHPQLVLALPVLHQATYNQ